MHFIDARLHTDMIEDKRLPKLQMMRMEATIVSSPLKPFRLDKATPDHRCCWNPRDLFRLRAE